MNKPKQIKEKMLTAKMKGYPYTLVYLLYNYYECPICHWFKLVKKSKPSEDYIYKQPHNKI